MENALEIILKNIEEAQLGRFESSPVKDLIVPNQPLSIKTIPGYETYAIDSNTIGIRPNWIKCTEQLPKENEHVLVYDKKEGICRGYHSYGSWQHYPLGSFAGDGCLFSVGHWMPLPPVPES